MTEDELRAALASVKAQRRQETDIVKRAELGYEMARLTEQIRKAQMAYQKQEAQR